MESKVVIYYSEGDRTASEMMKTCAKNKLSYKFIDFRELLLHQESEKNKNALEQIDTSLIQDLPVIFIDNKIQKYYSKYAPDMLIYIEHHTKGKK